MTGTIYSSAVAEPQVWLTQQEAAERLRVSVRTINNYRRGGRLKGRKLGRRWLFRIEDVDALPGAALDSNPEEQQ